MVNVLNDRFHLDVDAFQFIGYVDNHFKTTKSRQKRSTVPLPKQIATAKPSDLKLAIQAHVGIPIPLTVNLATIAGTGEYNFMRGLCLCSEDELHFPVGIKPHTDVWWYTHDEITGYLVRTSVGDISEARELLANTLSVEDSTTLDGVATWLSIMGAAPPPDGLGKLYNTLVSSYSAPVMTPKLIAKDMPLWMQYTTGMQKRPPQFKTAGTKRAQQRTLDKLVLAPEAVEHPTYKLRFEDGLSERKKVDLRRSMVNRILEQGIQDSLAIKPLEDVLAAKYPLWLMMSDKAQITKTKADNVVNVSVANDIGTDMANLRSVVQQQMRIALDNKTSDKQKSGAMARAVQASRAIMTLRKEAGYFEQNNATKAGIFKNVDSTVLQDDGAQFDKLIEQLAAQQETTDE